MISTPVDRARIGVAPPCGFAIAPIWRIGLFSAVMGLGIAGCGQKGPLTLPPPAATPAAPAAPTTLNPTPPSSAVPATPSASSPRAGAPR